MLEWIKNIFRWLGGCFARCWPFRRSSDVPASNVQRSASTTALLSESFESMHEAIGESIRAKQKIVEAESGEISSEDDISEVVEVPENIPLNEKDKKHIITLAESGKSNDIDALYINNCPNPIDRDTEVAAVIRDNIEKKMSNITKLVDKSVELAVKDEPETTLQSKALASARHLYNSWSSLSRQVRENQSCHGKSPDYLADTLARSTQNDSIKAITKSIKHIYSLCSKMFSLRLFKRIHQREIEEQKHHTHYYQYQGVDANPAHAVNQRTLKMMRRFNGDASSDEEISAPLLKQSHR